MRVAGGARWMCWQSMWNRWRDYELRCHIPNVSGEIHARQMRRAYSPCASLETFTWGVAPGCYEVAPLALEQSESNNIEIVYV